MKHKNFFHQLVGFAKRELEITLAALIVLGLVFGYSLASADLEAGDLQIAQTTGGSSFMINSVPYSGINFTSTSVAGTYRFRATAANTSPSDVSQSPAGARGATAGQTYTFTQVLGSPFSGYVYLWGSASGARINNQSAGSSTSRIFLDNASQIVVSVPGGQTIARVALTAGMAEAPKTVGALSVLPGAASVQVGNTYTFIALARDAAGVTIETPTINWSVNNAQLATINQVGHLTALKAGTLIVTAKADGATASATVTIVEAPTTVPTKTTSTPTTQAPASTPTTAPTSDSTSVLDKISDALNGNQTTTPSTDGGTGTAVETRTQATIGAALDAFAATQASRIAEQGSAYVPNTEVKTIVAATATTATERIAVTFQLAVRQIVSDVREMFAPSSDKNVFKAIGSAIVNLFTRGAGATQEDDGGAAPTDVRQDEDDLF